jgi:hypothetical protein
MTIQMSQLFIYTPSPPASLRQFVEFWAERYHDPHELLYTQNINGPPTAAGFADLFRWKIGNRYFKSKKRLLKQCFIDRLGEAGPLLKQLAGQERREIARRFLNNFKDGGAIWRIFWLHCWDPNFPIYDQHVHRAMIFIKDKDNGKMEELGKFNHAEKVVQLYLDRYLPFFDEFPQMENRKLDKALWRFGKSLVDRSLPRIRK